MKITKKHSDGLTYFYDLDSGDIFLLKNVYYLKINRIDPKEGSYVNAVRIDTGEVYCFENDERIKKVEAELIVEV